MSKVFLMNVDLLTYGILKTFYRLIDERWNKENINQCLREQFQRNWNDDLQTCSKAINYRIFKDTFGFEDYFNILDEKVFFSSLQISNC